MQNNKKIFVCDFTQIRSPLANRFDAENRARAPKMYTHTSRGSERG